MIKNQSVSRSQAVFSGAVWAMNQAGYSFNEAGVEFGGSDNAQDIGPQGLQVEDTKPQNLAVELN